MATKNEKSWFNAIFRSVAQNRASIPVRHAPSETNYNDGKKDDKRNHNGLIVVYPREEAREEGGFVHG